MIGSEKQISWATDIKADCLAEMSAVEEFITSADGKAFIIRGYGETEPAERLIADVISAIRKTREFVIAQEQAKFFIDNRDRSMVRLAKADDEAYGIARSDMEMAARAAQLKK